MSWLFHKLRLRLKTDMHCGSLMLGFVARAFPYAPQHVPLYAAVPAAVEALNLPQEPASFREMEALLLSAMRATPLYVLHEGSPLFPWEPRKREQLEAAYLSSRYGVALDDASRSAEEGCLFETEVLLARRRGRMEATQLEGGIWLRPNTTDRLSLDPQSGIARNDGSAAIDWPTLLGRLTLGGDRTRSLGRLWPDVVWEPCDSLWHCSGMELDGAWPRFRLAAGQPCPMALAADSTPGTGQFSIMTGRRLKNNTYLMDTGAVAWQPGWKARQAVQIELDGERCARICASGVEC